MAALGLHPAEAAYAARAGVEVDPATFRSSRPRTAPVPSGPLAASTWRGDATGPMQSTHTDWLLSGAIAHPTQPYSETAASLDASVRSAARRTIAHRGTLQLRPVPARPATTSARARARLSLIHI